MSVKEVHMEHEAPLRITKAIAANPHLWNLAIFLFICGVFLLSLYIKIINNFTFMETVLAATGFKKFKRNWVVNIAHALVIIVPLFLMTYVIISHENT